MLREDWNNNQILDALNFIRKNFLFKKSSYPANVKINKDIFNKINILYPNMFYSVLEAYKLVNDDYKWNLFCPVCGKRNKFKTNHCSCVYTQLDNNVRLKNKLTKIFRYNDENYNNKDKNKRTCNERYGVDNVFQLDSVKEKSKNTKFINHGDKNYRNHEKRKQTCLNKMDENGDNVFKVIVKRAQNTNILRRGVKSPMQDKNVVKKHQENFMKNYGVKNPYCLQEIRKRIKKHKVSKKEKIWLDNFNIPKENRQVFIKGKFVDGLLNNVIYEFLGDYWHGHPNYLSNNLKLRNKYNNYLCEQFKNTKERFDFLNCLGYKIVYCWESDFKNNNKFFRLYKGVLEY